MSTPIFPLVDRILGGELEQVLRAYRSDGLSYEQISKRIDTDHAIDVTAETVRNWCRKLDIVVVKAKAS